MELVIYKYIPGPCRVCGTSPSVQRRWVMCKNLHCPKSQHRSPQNLWPRKQVIDWPATLKLHGLTYFQAFAMFAVIGIFCALLVLVGGGK